MADVRSEPIDVRARDGYRLAADLHMPVGEPRGAVIIAGAMGVRRQFYAPLAAFFAESGIAASTFDHRGMGGSRTGSLRGFAATLEDWVDLDLAAVVADLAGRFGGLPRAYLGHSLGGQLFGLLRDPPVECAVFVASQSGYVGDWPSRRGRLTMFAIWHLVVPALVPLAGRLPLEALGQGQDVPAGVALDWASWGRDREYVRKYTRLRPGLAFDRYAGPLRAYAIADDRYVPRRAVEALVAYYGAARGEVRVLSPREVGVDEIGHFGAFRRSFAGTLWPELRTALFPASRSV